MDHLPDVVTRLDLNHNVSPVSPVRLTSIFDDLQHLPVNKVSYSHTFKHTEPILMVLPINVKVNCSHCTMLKMMHSAEWIL